MFKALRKFRSKFTATYQRITKKGEKMAWLTLADATGAIEAAVPTGGYQQVDRSLDPLTGLKVMRTLWERDIPVNATLIFNSTQAFWAGLAGAVCVSPFVGRIADYLYRHDHPERPDGNALYWIEDHKNSRYDQHVANTEYVASGGKRKDAGIRLVREIVQVFSLYDIQAEVLAASFRNLPRSAKLCLRAQTS
jgi:transaldolase